MALQMTYYDREADIVYVGLRDVEVASSEEREWGLIDLGDDDKPVGMEYWAASKRLPADFLATLPDPAATEPQAA